VQDRGVGVINASLLSMGLLTGRGPPSWHPAGTEIRDTCRKAAEFCKVVFSIWSYSFSCRW